jgi:hypothetical protein
MYVLVCSKMIGRGGSTVKLGWAGLSNLQPDAERERADRRGAPWDDLGSAGVARLGGRRLPCLPLLHPPRPNESAAEHEGHLHADRHADEVRPRLDAKKLSTAATTAVIAAVSIAASRCLEEVSEGTARSGCGHP